MGSVSQNLHLEISKIRNDFPILSKKVNGKPLVYFDNAATTQRPAQVIEAIDSFYRETNSNVYRGVHELSERATEQFELAREKVAKFINAKSPNEIIFVRGTTEAINLVAYSYGKKLVKGNRVLLSFMEHHSNVVPWQFLHEKGVELDYVDITDDGRLKLEDYYRLMSDQTKIVSMTHVSNVLGTVNPVSELAKIAHEKGSLILVDGAQSIPHLSIDVQEMDCDFFAFSGHKMFGPTGIGVLYAKESILEQMDPFMGGGSIIKEVQLDHSTWNDLPYKFEAGTPNIAGAIGLGTAIDYLKAIGMENIRKVGKELIKYALEALPKVGGIELYGPDDPRDRVEVFSFNLPKIHAHDVASIANDFGVAIRSGHHCAQPLMRRLGVPATSRASLYAYNTREEIDVFVKSLEKVKEVFN
ncbi:MAG: cysteine desulfurase [Thaumarchaeota archaeon]|nr:cysteine desulfurase [Nitrososphaerota archaeon]